MKYTRLDPSNLAVMVKLSNQLCKINELLSDGAFKFDRIKGSENYSQIFSYDPTGDQNVTSIVHTGTTSNGIETITQTFAYVDPTINGSNITSITLS